MACYDLLGQPINPIRLNQVGFYPMAPKTAIVVDSVGGKFFVRKMSGDTAYSGELGELKSSGNSSLQTRVAYFHGLRTPGTYTISANGKVSYPFKVAPSVHYQAVVAALKGFYYQRLTSLERKHAGKWARAAGHPDTRVLIHPSAARSGRTAGTPISSPGGWYDAGDYNKYIVNSGITMGTLMSAYEDFRNYFDTLNTNIPESNNGVPDILDEVAQNLFWMLTMQDADGGVYHKCTNANFDGMVMPGVTRLPRYVVQKSTAATLDFAAVMAQAARIYSYRKYPGLTKKCIQAAERAWRWAENNPNVLYNQDSLNKLFDPDITTGAYGDRNLSDEWFWAATELFITTTDQKYLSSLKQYLHLPATLPTWSNVYLLGYYSLTRFKNKLPKSLDSLQQTVSKKIVDFADEYVRASARNAFETAMGKSRQDFNWGSSSNAANQGILLVYAYHVTSRPHYLNHALSNLDYLLGRNATGYSFLTGVGTKTPMNPHHRPSVADGIEEPIPGLLVGGPNPARQDNCKYEFTEPETAYTDDDCSYASNEIAINWNAPLVYLAAALEALQQKLYVGQ